MRWAMEKLPASFIHPERENIQIKYKKMLSSNEHGLPHYSSVSTRLAQSISSSSSIIRTALVAVLAKNFHGHSYIGDTVYNIESSLDWQN